MASENNHKLISSSQVIILFVSVGLSLMISLAGLVRAGDTKDISENRAEISEVKKHVENVEQKTTQNCQEIAVIKASFDDLKRRLGKIESNLDAQNDISRQILQEIKKK